MLQTLSEGRDICLCLHVSLRISHQHSDAVHGWGLLRANSERRQNRADAANCEEIPPLHAVPPCEPSGRTVSSTRARAEIAFRAPSNRQVAAWSRIARTCECLIG